MRTCFRLACTAVIYSSAALCHAQPNITPPTDDLAKMIAEYPKRLCPVDATVLRGSREWLEYVTCRLQSLLQTSAHRALAEAFQAKFDLDELLREVRTTEPDPARLQQLAEKFPAAVTAAQAGDSLPQDLQAAYELARVCHEALETVAESPALTQELQAEWGVLNEEVRAFATQPVAKQIQHLARAHQSLRSTRDLWDLVSEKLDDHQRQQLEADLQRAAKIVRAHEHLSRAMVATESALGTYAALVEVEVSSTGLQTQLLAQLEALGMQFRQCEQAPSRDHVAELHQTLSWLRQHRQALPLTEAIRARYLVPVVRVDASERLLNDAAAQLRIRQFPRKGEQDGVRFDVQVTLDGRLQIDSAPCDDHATLRLSYCDRVLLDGLVQRKRLCLALNSGLAVNVGKSFFLIQDLPDSGPAHCNSEVLWVDTDRGRLVDRVVEGVARRKLAGGGLQEELGHAIDEHVSRLANAFSLHELPAMRRLAERGVSTSRDPGAASAARPAILERRYSSSASSVKLVVQMSDERLALRVPPPAPLPGEDFCISIHESALNALTVPDLLGERERHTLRALGEVVSRALAVEGIFDNEGLSGVRIWTPPKEQFLFFHEGQLDINFLAAREKQPAAEAFVCNLHIDPSRIKFGDADSSTGAAQLIWDTEALKIRILDGGRNAADQAAFQQQLREGVSPKVRPAWGLLPSQHREANSPTCRRPSPDQPKLFRVRADKDYLTVGVQLKSNE